MPTLQTPPKPSQLQPQQPPLFDPTPRHRPRQRPLALDPQPDEVLAEAERMWLNTPYWRRRYRSLDDLLADPQRKATLLTCARQSLRARWRAEAGKA